MAVNDQQFCLRWNNHQSTLISVFDSLLENGTLVDCTIAAEGQYLKAHKVVLSACSPYLEVLLSQHYEKHPIVILKDVKFSELKSMMDYMYKGEVNISQDQLGTFLKAAESLQIKGLSDNGDEGAVGSSAPKKDPPARPSVTQTRAPAESKRPAPSGDVSDASRDGSISPSSIRKRRRTRRPSQGDDPDNHFDSSNVCDPAAQSTPMPVPNVTVPTPVIPKQIVKQEPNLSINDTGLKKEIIDPPTEPLLEPKTEYLDYMNNENSIEVEDLTLDDDDDLDSSMDASRPGPSHGDMSNQGYQWPMTGDQSGTDEIFMAAQEAVGAATAQQQRDSQGVQIIQNDQGVTVELVDSIVWVKAIEVEVASSDLPQGIASQGNLTQKKKRIRPKAPKKEEPENENILVDEISGSYKCKRCGKVFDKKAVIQRHLNFYCVDSRIYHCEFCPYKTKTDAHFDAHMKRFHSDWELGTEYSVEYEDLPPTEDAQDGSEQAASENANEPTPLAENPTEALESESQELIVKKKTTVKAGGKIFIYDLATKVYTCKTCGISLKLPQTVEKHKNVPCSANVKRKVYKCTMCDFSISAVSVYRSHMGTKHGIWPEIDLSKGEWTFSPQA